VKILEWLFGWNEWLWSLLPDKCEREDCSRSGTRGNENRINGKIVCDYCCMDDRRVKLVGGSTIYAHDKTQCDKEVCCIHNPSDHHMKEWPQNWRSDRGMMERICPHGTGHPDPDDLNEDTVHGCDGCCRPLMAMAIQHRM